MMVLAWEAWAAVRDLELPSPKTGASDEGGLVSSLLSETVVTCSTFAKRCELNKNLEINLDM